MLQYYFLITHHLRKFYKKNSWTKLKYGKLLFRLFIINFSAAFISQTFVAAIMIFPYRIMTFEEASFPILLIYVFNTTVILWLWSLIYFGVHHFENYKNEEVEKWKLKSSLKDAELIALKSQINPHFLFNSLNNIKALIYEDPGKAGEMISAISDLLRYSIQMNEQRLVKLSDELEIVKDYLALESIHFEDRLNYEIIENGLSSNILVPPMSVQHLVENAIKHGISQSTSGGKISVSFLFDEEQYLIKVVNTGQLVVNGNSTSVGLKTNKERLKILFGDKSDLQLAQINDKEIEATIKIPKDGTQQLRQ